MTGLTNVTFRKMLLPISFCLMFSACEGAVEVPEAGDLIRFSDFECAATRTTMNGNQASFVAGDKIGIYETLTGKSNVLFTYPSAISVPMYWKNSTQQHTFYAYYPYNASVSGTSVSMPVLSAQTVSGIPDSNSDMLVSTLSTTKVPAVNLNFTHAFAILKFNVSPIASLLGLLTPGTITLSGGNPANSTGSNYYGMFNTTNDVTKISYNLATQSIVCSANTSAVFKQTNFTANLPAMISNVSTIYILILPGTYANPAPSVKLTATLLGTGILTSSSKSLTVTSFLPNKLYEFNVTLSRGNDTRIPQNREAEQTNQTGLAIDLVAK